MTQTTLRNLILVQCIYEVGEESFDKVAATVNKHPLLSQEKNIDASQCEALYNDLLTEYNIAKDENGQVKKGGRKNGPQPWVKTLAQVLYTKYTQELMGEMKQDEEEFKAEYAQLQELQKP